MKFQQGQLYKLNWATNFYFGSSKRVTTLNSNEVIMFLESKNAYWPNAGAQECDFFLSAKGIVYRYFMFPWTTELRVFYHSSL